MSKNSIFFYFFLVVSVFSHTHQLMGMEAPPGKGDALKVIFDKKQDIDKYIADFKTRGLINKASNQAKMKNWTLLHAACYDANTKYIKKLCQIPSQASYASISGAIGLPSKDRKLPIELYVTSAGADIKIDILKMLIRGLFKSTIRPQLIAFVKNSFDRAGKKAKKHGFDFNKIIEELKLSLPMLTTSIKSLKTSLSRLAGRLSSL